MAKIKTTINLCDNTEPFAMTGVTFKVDKKSMIRNLYNRIPNPDPNTKWERDTYN